MMPTARQPDRQPTDQLPDTELVARVRAGETALYELIMRRHNRRLFRIARGILGEDGEAEDAVQEAYVQAYFKLEQFRGPDGFGGWLCRIASNEALMRRRRRIRHQHVALSALEQPANQEAAMADPDSAIDNPEAALHAQQLHQLLEHAVDALPEAYRAAFVMREVEQMSVAETADCLGIEQATVKTRVHRARQILQRGLTAELSAALSGTFAFDGARCDRVVARVFQRLGNID